jgi:hypothetical protein
MKLIEHARKGHVMNIKEDYYIYKFKQLNELIEEQKITKDNNNQNNLFDIALRHEYTPIVNVVHHEFIPRGRTVSGQFYLEVMKRLREAE